MTRHLEERITCEDAEGKRYEVEVYREVTRLEDNSQELDRREAFLSGDPPRQVKAFDDEHTFQTEEGSVLRRIKMPDQPGSTGTGRG